MRFPQSLVGATLVRRYKRFLADVVLDTGETTTAHCANPGAMTGLVEPGTRVWLSRSTASSRKLPLTLEIVEVGGARVGVNTLLANRIVEEAIVQNCIPELAEAGALRREAAYVDGGRADFRLTRTTGQGVETAVWIEVKSVTLSRQPSVAEWPDCISARASRHVAHLQHVAVRGERSVLLFLVQREDCPRFAVASDIDSAFAQALKTASAAGVEILAYACKIDLDGIKLDASRNLET